MARILGEKVWAGKPPQACDLCGLRIMHSFVDGRTSDGRWGIMCPRCRVAEGRLELGTGLGQKYERHSDGDAVRWVKVAG